MVDQQAADRLVHVVTDQAIMIVLTAKQTGARWAVVTKHRRVHTPAEQSLELSSARHVLKPPSIRDTWGHETVCVIATVLTSIPPSHCAGPTGDAG